MEVFRFFLRVSFVGVERGKAVVIDERDEKVERRVCAFPVFLDEGEHCFDAVLAGEDVDECFTVEDQVILFDSFDEDSHEVFDDKTAVGSFEFSFGLNFGNDLL